MNTATDTTNTEKSVADRIVESFYDRTQHIGATDSLGHAADHFADGLGYALKALHEGGERDTAAPGDVVRFLDEVDRARIQVRAEAVAESRRRLDAAMERTAYLEGDAR